MPTDKEIPPIIVISIWRLNCIERTENGPEEEEKNETKPTVELIRKPQSSPKIAIIPILIYAYVQFWVISFVALITYVRGVMMKLLGACEVCKMYRVTVAGATQVIRVGRAWAAIHVCRRLYKDRIWRRKEEKRSSWRWKEMESGEKMYRSLIKYEYFYLIYNLII